MFPGKSLYGTVQYYLLASSKNKKKGFVTAYVFHVTVWLFLNASETGSVCFPKIGSKWVISFFFFFSFLTKNVEHITWLVPTGPTPMSHWKVLTFYWQVPVYQESLVICSFTLDNEPQRVSVQHREKCHNIMINKPVELDKFSSVITHLGVEQKTGIGFYKKQNMFNHMWHTLYKYYVMWLCWEGNTHIGHRPVLIIWPCRTWTRSFFTVQGLGRREYFRMWNLYLCPLVLSLAMKIMRFGFSLEFGMTERKKRTWMNESSMKQQLKVGRKPWVLLWFQMKQLTL